jgi:CheY-like chemotaxis protein
MYNNTILIVDDDSDDRMILKDSFDPGLLPAIAFFETGDSLLAYLNSIEDVSTLPRLIISDLNMPRMDGLEMIKKLKQHPKYERIPIVILSTAGKNTHEQICLRLGASAYYEKPDSYTALKGLLQKFIGMAQL